MHPGTACSVHSLTPSTWPDGVNYPNESVFRDIVVPERIAFAYLSGSHHFFMTITLATQGDQTLVVWRQVFDTAAHRERVADIVLAANEQNLDRLAAEVHHIG